MLSLFFHRWERRLADVSKDRTVRPFEWGLDWIDGVTPGEALRERLGERVVGDRTVVREREQGAPEPFAVAPPEPVEIESIGESHEGRDIWLVTITNPATGPHDEKPALFVEANIHATEITASTAALHLVHHLATRYGTDDAVTRALDTRCFYVVPRLNPDGVALDADGLLVDQSMRCHRRFCAR